MDFTTAVGITVGLLAGAWVYASNALSLIGYAGFLGWASFFAAGGKEKGLKSAIITNLSGVFWGAVTMQVANFMGGLGIPSLIFTIVFAAIMCWQAKINMLGFIPGTFIGNAAYYASGCNIIGSAVALVIGAVLGYISEKSAYIIEKKDK